MDLSFTPEIATEYVKYFTPFITIIITYIVTRNTIQSIYKITLSLLLSLIFTALLTYSNNGFSNNFWMNLFILIGATHTFYQGLWKTVIEPRLNPKIALEQSVSPVVKNYIHSLPSETVKSILNPTTTKALDIKLGIAYGDKTITDKQFIGSGGKVGTIQK